MTTFVKSTFDSHILRLTLNRPEKKNALTQAMYLSLATQINLANNNDDVHVILIDCEGDDFCSGNDIQDFVDHPLTDNTAPVIQFLYALLNAEKPLIAAVKGMTVGVGVTMLLHCDCVLSDDTAVFSLPFVQLGLCVEAGASYLLPRLCGYQQAAQLLLLGEPFEVQQAKAMGLVTTILPQEKHQNAAWQTAQKLANLPPDAVQTTRRLMKSADKAALQQAMQEEIAEFTRLMQQDEAQQRLKQFLQR